MNFIGNSIDGIKVTLVILIAIIVSSAVGASIVSFKILLFGAGVASFIGIISDVYHISKDSRRSEE